MTTTGNGVSDKKLRSRAWFDNPDNPDMTALYLERYLNFGLSREELQSGKPIIGIAQTGSDLSPCNRHHIVLAQRVREGIREAGGIAMEFPTHPIQETGKRPTAALDRNLAYLGLVEILFGYPLDGVVLTTGCDKTTPACLMAAATVNLPAIVLSCTCFVRFIVVFGFVRTGLGTPSVPPNQVLVGLALFMAVFVSAPVGMQIYDTAGRAYLDGKIDEKQAFEQATPPLRTFLLHHTTETDLALFYEVSNAPRPSTIDKRQSGRRNGVLLAGRA